MAIKYQTASDPAAAGDALVLLGSLVVAHQSLDPIALLCFANAWPELLQAHTNDQQENDDVKAHHHSVIIATLQALFAHAYRSSLFEPSPQKSHSLAVRGNSSNHT
jgi:hypothetical protein